MSGITRTQSVLGGKPRIAGTRISVELIISYLANGLDVADIKRDYPFLTDAQIAAALEYSEKSITREKAKLTPAHV